MTKVMLHIIGARKKADLQKGVGKAKSLGTSDINYTDAMAQWLERPLCCRNTWGSIPLSSHIKKL